MPRALVVGGGVAGPVVAMALQRAGWDTTVHEAYPHVTDGVGAWLGVQVNGLDALRAIEADEPLVAAGFPTPEISFVNGRGKPLGTTSTGTPRPGASGGVSMKRSDLYRVVHGEALRRGIDLRYSSTLVDAETTATGVTARFADGSTDTADLLIGADGVRSRVRTVLDPQAPAPRYVPVLNVAGFSDHQVPGAQVGHLTMIFGRRVFVGYLPAPDGTTWWFANPPHLREPAPGEIGAITDAQWRQRLRDLLAEDDSPALALVEATPGELRGWTTYDLPSVPVWQGERMVLIGDAAHATSPAAGQGTSMAIEDAVVLAQCLRDLPVFAALAHYEGLRRARVEKVVASGARMSSGKLPNVAARTGRDLLMPVIMRRVARRGGGPLSWAQHHHIDWDAPVRPGTTVSTGREETEANPQPG